MNLERQESSDQRDWDSFRDTFPTILFLQPMLLRTPFFLTWRVAQLQSLAAEYFFTCFPSIVLSWRFIVQKVAPISNLKSF